MREIKFRAKSMSAYGLNKMRSFISSPTCECGCNGKLRIHLDDIDDLVDFSYDLLLRHGCGESAIFAHALDGSMYAFLCFELTEDNIEEIEGFFERDLYEYDFGELVIIPTKIDNEDIELFQDLDGYWRLCCYGLLQEVRNGEWEIIDD